MDLIERVEAEVEAIRKMSKDNEAAHIREDMLLMDVLHAIANGCEKPAEVASAAREVYKITYTRWYA